MPLTIRRKLLYYYGVFLAISYGIAAVLTGVFYFEWSESSPL